MAAGIFTTIGFYLYNGAAAFLLVIPTSAVLSRLLPGVLPKSSAAESPIRWKVLIFYSIVVILVALPMFLSLTAGPSPEVERSLRLSHFSRANSFTHFLELLVDSLVAYAQPFLALGGDTRWYSNLPGRPILDPVLAVSFVAGTVISLKRIRQLPYLFLLVYWVGMVAPGVLTVAGLSNSAFYFRIAGALPPTYIVVALAWVELYYWLTEYLASSSQRGGATIRSMGSPGAFLSYWFDLVARRHLPRLFPDLG